MATDDKYDRQLRLWGAHGQQALMQAKLCMLGSSPVATETLKNMVLPGIGHFTIIDDATVQKEDLGNNFFIETGDVGKPRAEATCACLLEMNPDVQGRALVRDPVSAVQEGRAFFEQFHLVVACQLPEQSAVQLCGICEDLNIPVVFVTAVGFVGKIRIYVAEHPVIETKPEPATDDLRIMEPFPELKLFALEFDFEALDQAEHAHVPYVVILIKALDTWSKQNDGKSLPSTKEEKAAYKGIVAGMRKTQEEVNFDEADSNAYKACVAYRISDEVRQILKLETKFQDSDFWVVARAVSQFVQDAGKLPLSGALPDMTASTSTYTRLQEIYNSRAKGDLSAVTARVAAILAETGQSGRSVSDEYVRRFCQNVRDAEVFCFHTLAQELQPLGPEDGGLDLACELEDEDSLVQWYLAFRALELFRQEHACWPGANCADTDEAAIAEHVEALKKAAAKIVESYGAEGVTADVKMLEELARYGGSELNPTSSVLGAMAAQEAVKLLTKQQAPLNNTLLYDGLNGKMQALIV